MTELTCRECGTGLEWKGKGRKPKYCPPCKKKADRAKRAKRAYRDFQHSRGKSGCRWGELWLIDGKAIRRDARYVWGATGDTDDTTFNRSGVFHYIGAYGLPNGMSVPTTNDYADLRQQIKENHRLATKSEEAKAWLDAHPDWWRFETFAHQTFAKDVSESVAVHGGTVEDHPDETSPRDRCSFCGLRRPLVLAGEFCGDACMTDYVITYGPDGLDLGGGFDAHDERGMVEARHRADAPVVYGIAA